MIQLPVDPMVTFTRSTVGHGFDVTGAIVASAINVLRLDVDPVTLAARGLLLEGSTAELIPQSAITTTWWVNFGSPTLTYLTLNALGQFPGVQVASGGAVADRIGLRATAPIACTSGTEMQIDLYYRSGTSGRLRWQALDDASAAVCRITGVIGALSVTTATGGTMAIIEDVALAGGTERRLRVSFIPNFTGAFRLSGGPDSAVAGESVILLGLFVRAEDHQGSPIITTAGGLTRAADFASINPGPWFNAAAGTGVIDLILPNPLPVPPRVALQFDDGSTANRIRLRLQNFNAHLTVASGGVDVAELNGGAVAAGASLKIAFAYAAGAFAISVGGAACVTGAAGAVPVGINRFHLGRTGSSQFLDGWIKSLVWFPDRKTNADLQALAA